MRFEAPWATAVKVISLAVTALLLFAAFEVNRRAAGELDGPWLHLVVAVPLLILFGSLLFTVRGYRLEGSSLFVERLLWATEIPLAGLRSARHDPEAMKRSLRLFGNGGLYGITGLFSNKTLGRYRAYATDPANAVVLELDGRTVLVTPGRPEELVRALSALCAEA